MRLRAYSLALAGVIAFGGLVGAARPAHADKEKTYKIATYVLGAGTLYALTKKKGTLALIGAAGTYFAYKKWKDAANDRRHGRRVRKHR
ncbi:MAG TPA: hypothetical protein VFU47_09335 [Armatimonadota bacterium]|nr:hypothetical protein [Armatimonadota bacterium]